MDDGNRWYEVIFIWFMVMITLIPFSKAVEWTAGAISAWWLILLVPVYFSIWFVVNVASVVFIQDFPDWVRHKLWWRRHRRECEQCRK